jgi:tRNA threonylcarbamoyladenosine biosynthesis protein TsaE
MQCITHTQEQTIALGKKIGASLHGGDVIALSGELAAGKTTLTKGIALALGVTQTVTSPTFTIISEYEGHLPLYHIDAYRLSGADDFINLGADDIIFGNGVCVIEWSERIQSELPAHTMYISIETRDNDTRVFTITGTCLSGECFDTE